MRIRIAAVMVLASLGAGLAQADRVAGLAGIVSLRPAAAPAAPTPVALQSGVISGRSADGKRVEIDGRAWIVKAGRTQLLRRGLPVAVDAPAKGQTVRFSPASATPGEQALGVVHVP